MLSTGKRCYKKFCALPHSSSCSLLLLVGVRKYFPVHLWSKRYLGMKKILFHYTSKQASETGNYSDQKLAKMNKKLMEVIPFIGIITLSAKQQYSYILQLINSMLMQETRQQLVISITVGLYIIHSASKIVLLLYSFNLAFGKLKCIAQQ